MDVEKKIREHDAQIQGLARHLFEWREAVENRIGKLSEKAYGTRMSVLEYARLNDLPIVIGGDAMEAVAKIAIEWCDKHGEQMQIQEGRMLQDHPIPAKALRYAFKEFYPEAYLM